MQSSITNKGNKNMSNYTPVILAAMQSNDSFDYDSASAFASAHGLSVRSVISKVKHLGISYTPKVKTVSTAGPRITKADLVEAIAKAMALDVESIRGLDKADAKALNTLLEHIA
jgi:hypothetical protein|tara:strand:+ start:771 stop:1112 length:342 start_codon:yes stop_codon:yes gene_type:complete